MNLRKRRLCTGSRRDAWRAAVALAGLLALVATVAHAHSVQYPKRHTLMISPTRIRLETQLDVHGGPDGSALRQRFDLNGDERLDQDEAQELARSLVTEALHPLTLTVGGKPVALKLVALSDDGLAGPVVVLEHQSLAAVEEATLASPAMEIRLADSVNEGMRRIPVIVEVDGMRVVSTSLGRIAVDPVQRRTRIDAAEVTSEAPLVIHLAQGRPSVTHEGR